MMVAPLVKAVSVQLSAISERQGRCSAADGENLRFLACWRLSADG